MRDSVGSMVPPASARPAMAAISAREMDGVGSRPRLMAMVIRSLSHTSGSMSLIMGGNT
jgi:hypothetical protein